MTVKQAGLGPRHVDHDDALVIGIDDGTLSGRAVMHRLKAIRRAAAGSVAATAAVA